MADELLKRNAELDRTSGRAGIVTVHADTTAAFISSQQCRSCLIKGSVIATCYVELDGTAATATCARLDDTYIPLPIANLSMVNIYATATATVFVIWRD